MAKKDYYLQSLYDTLTMCDLVIQNRQALGEEKVQQAKKLKAETEQRIGQYQQINGITLIEAPEGTHKLGHTVSHSPILGEEGQMIERYELVLEADFLPCSCAYAADPSEFRAYIQQWETTGKVWLPEI